MSFGTIKIIQFTNQPHFQLNFLALFYSIQDNFLFFPDIGLHRRCVQSPSIFHLPFETVYIKTRDKVTLHAYFIRHTEQKGSSVPTIIFFHGNAGNIGGRLGNANGIFHNLQCNILLVGEITTLHIFPSSKVFSSLAGIYYFRVSRIWIIYGPSE